MTTPANLGINPFYCGEDQLAENFEKIVEQLTHALPKVGCAKENWRYIDAIGYPSHPQYPSCPTFSQMPHVMVSAPLATDPDVKVFLPCPRSRDPNIEAGDSVVYHNDAQGNPIYQGGHDDPIGTQKWWHGKPAEVPKGWYWVTNSPPGSYNTRTGRWADGFGKYVKNYFATPEGTDPTLGTLGMHCNGNDASLSIADHNFVPGVTVADHPFHQTTSDLTGITAAIDCSNSYVGDYCLTSMYGYVDIRNHDHVVPLTETTIGEGTGTPRTVQGIPPTSLCSNTATVPPCGSPLPPVPVGIYDTCHNHHLYLDCDITLIDPRHFHGFLLPPHIVTVAPITLGHAHSLSQQTLPRVYSLFIERLNNAANVVGSPTPAGVYCGPGSTP